MKKLFDARSGRCMLHTWGGNGWQFTEVTVFGADGYAVHEDLCGGVDAEPLGLFISRITGLGALEAEVLATETTARWRDSGEEAEQTQRVRKLLRQFSSALLGGVSVAAAAAAGARLAKRRRSLQVPIDHEGVPFPSIPTGSGNRR